MKTRRVAWSACRRSASDRPETEETAKTCTAPACSITSLATNLPSQNPAKTVFSPALRSHPPKFVIPSEVRRQPNAVEGPRLAQHHHQPLRLFHRDAEWKRGVELGKRLSKNPSSSNRNNTAGSLACTDVREAAPSNLDKRASSDWKKSAEQGAQRWQCPQPSPQFPCS
jgi:hypothetical protein